MSGNPRASVNDDRQERFRETSFRSGMTSREGLKPGMLIDAKVTGVNMVNWTVDVASTFDRKKYLNIQVSSPYLHFSNGEGFFAMPEVGAKCSVCLPSDSSPPFVLAFLMPFEKIEDSSTPDAPSGTRSHGGTMQNATDARFDGGRMRAKPGDIGMRGRDGNFVVLHRGGVLEIGANELSQRIFIPLDNHMLDISERYSHHNLGGSILWGLAEGQKENAVANVETFRVFADSKYADIRISKGYVGNPVDPEGGLPETVVYEVVISPEGFNADSGDLSGTGAPVVYKFAVDRAGNIATTIAGDVFCHFKKKLTIKLDDALEFSGKSGHMSFSDGFTLEGGKSTHINGDIVRLGAGLQPLARKGDFVSTKVTIPVPAIIAFPGAPNSGPCTISFVGSLGGVIVSGNDKLRG